jgi:S1-C subfamily serine protease
MSVDTPHEPEPKQLVLRREALLPNERSRGLGTVAVVCTMAGVASGLALATTLMAMQVADSMSMRSCPYRVVQTPVVESVNLQPDHGFLGIRYVFHDGYADVDSVIPNTPAEMVALQPGDHVLAIDGASLHSAVDLQERIYNAHPGMQPTLTVERNGVVETYHPTLVAWPVINY